MQSPVGAGRQNGGRRAQSREVGVGVPVGRTVCQGSFLQAGAGVNQQVQSTDTRAREHRGVLLQS